MKKLFSEILKENLTSNVFLNDLSPKPSYSLNNLHPVKKEIHKYFINLKELLKVYNSIEFYRKLFKNPVKNCFYWCEEDFQGSLFTIYEYNGWFIYTRGGFGSCEVCDGLVNSQERLDKIFLELKITDDINIHGNLLEYTHPELIDKFNTFKDTSELVKDSKPAFMV